MTLYGFGSSTPTHAVDVARYSPIYEQFVPNVLLRAKHDSDGLKARRRNIWAYKRDMPLFWNFENK